LFTLGGGYTFRRFDLRLEVPILVPFSETGEAAGVIPLFTLTGGYRFGLRAGQQREVCKAVAPPAIPSAANRRRVAELKIPLV
jgi:hypothetical protein